MDTVLFGDKKLADVDDILGDVTASYTLGQAAELGVTLTDTGDKMTRSDLARTGTQLSVDGNPWEIGGIRQANLGDDAVTWTLRARSELTRKLRQKYADKVAGIRSTTWVTNRAEAAGGTAFCQPSARRAKVEKSADRSILDVIDALSADLGWSWAEYGKRLYFMDPHWAWTEQPLELPSWAVSWRQDPRTDALGVDTTIDPDDTAVFGSGTLKLPYDYGRRMRPFHTVNLGRGLAGPRAGTWVITGVDYTVNRPEVPVTVAIARPRKGIPAERTSTATGGDGGTIGDLGDAEWIDGADRVWPKCTRSPKQAVQFGIDNLGPSWYGDGYCLAWVSVAFKGSQGLGGELAYYVWANAPASAIKMPGNTRPPAGAVVVWKPESMGGHGGRAGHIGISLGGGKFVSATSGQIRIDTITGGWASGYYGAMTPSF